MQLSISPIIRQNPITGKREQEHRNIRAKSTGTPQIIPDNSFLKECFTHIALTEIINWSSFEKTPPSKENIQRLIKAATGYLALYGQQLLFTPSGNVGRDMTDLIHAVTPLLPEGQLLNVDYIDNEFVFIVYQSHPLYYWSTITYIPISIVETMRPKIRKLFFRFIAFIMQQNNLPTIKDSYEYEIFLEDVKYNMANQREEVEACYIETMRDYKNKRGKAYRMLEHVTQCNNYHPNDLLTELKSLKRLSTGEKEQIQCMIRGLEILSRDSLIQYSYDSTYDNVDCNYADDNEEIRWYDLICISWGTPSTDVLTSYHYEGFNERCNNFGATEPYSSMILSPEKFNKLPPCSFPFEWLDYICNDFYKYLVIDE